MSSKLKLIESYLNKKKKHYRRDTFNGLVFEDILIFAQFYEIFKTYYNESKGNAEDLHNKIKQQDILLGVVMNDLGMTDIFDAYKDSEYKSKEYKVNYKDILCLYIHLRSVHIMYGVFNDIQIKRTPPSRQPVSATNNIISQPNTNHQQAISYRNRPPRIIALSDYNNNNNNNNSISQPNANHQQAISVVNQPHINNTSVCGHKRKLQLTALESPVRSLVIYILDFFNNQCTIISQILCKQKNAKFIQHGNV